MRTRRARRLALDEVLQPARRGDEHVGAARTLDLPATARRRRPGAKPLAACDRAEVVGDLQASSRVGTRTSAAGGPRPADALDDRQRERERLARAGRGLGEDVGAAKSHGDDALLNLER
jgi:hypothetical protein